MKRIRLSALGAACVAGIIGGILASLFLPPQAIRYEATSRLLVGPLDGSRSTLDAAGLLTTTFAEILESDDVIREAAEEVGADFTEFDVQAVADTRSRFIVLIVRGDDSASPLVMSVELTQSLLERVAGPDSLPASELQAGQVQILSTPQLSAPPRLGSRWFQVIGIGVLAAALGGLGSLLPRRPRGDEPSADLVSNAKLAGSLNLGAVFAGHPDSRLLEAGKRWEHSYQPGSAGIEAFDLCAHRLIQAAKLDEQAQAIALVAPGITAKHVLAASVLSTTLSRAGLSVDLVDSPSGMFADLLRVTVPSESTRSLNGSSVHESSEPLCTLLGIESCAELTSIVGGGEFRFVSEETTTNTTNGSGDRTRSIRRIVTETLGGRTPVVLVEPDFGGLAWISSADRVVLLFDDDSKPDELKRTLRRISTVGVTPFAFLQVSDNVELGLVVTS
jgi:hypothetical protein